MTPDFDPEKGPGEGWRRTDTEDGIETLVRYDDRGRQLARWVREEPVPPLPTEPYTVIRVTWREETTRDPEFTYRPRGGNYVNSDDLMWCSSEGPHSSVWLGTRIIGWEPLAEPPLHIVFKQDEEHDAEVRRETAKAVFDLVARDVDLGMAGGVLRERLNYLEKEYLNR